MNYQDTQIGQSVVRIKGNEAVGRTGEIIDRDEQKNRVRIGKTIHVHGLLLAQLSRPLYLMR